MGLGSLFQDEKTGNSADSLERKHVCWPRGAHVTLEPLWEHLVLSFSPLPGPQHCLEITLLIGGLFLLSTRTLSLQSGEPWKVHMFLTISCSQNMNSRSLAAASTSEWVCRNVQ